MRGFALVIVLMGLAAASAMADVENQGEEDFGWIADEQLVETSRAVDPVTQYKCPACYKHLKDMLVGASLNYVLKAHCSSLSTPTARTKLARDRCIYLTQSPYEVAKMITTEMIKTMCKNGNRC